jgi:hypothetical protein
MSAIAAISQRSASCRLLTCAEVCVNDVFRRKFRSVKGEVVADKSLVLFRFPWEVNAVVLCDSTG